MFKIFLLIIGINTFILAEYKSESELMIEQNLDDLKKKYHIQDETLAEVDTIDKPTTSSKDEFYIPQGSVAIKEPLKEETVLPQMKLELPNQTESLTSTSENKLEKIRRELGIKELTDKEKKLDVIRHELDIHYEAPKKESFLDKKVENIQKTLHMDGEIEGEYSFSNTVDDLKKTLNLDGESSWGIPSFGLPSLFGEEKKKKKEKGLFGIGALGGVQDTGKSLYKGMKYSGQSAEMMSGMMYNSSKMYNTMFGLFDDSPFNIFEEEEDPSVFDFIEGGNSIMKLFD